MMQIGVNDGLEDVRAGLLAVLEGFAEALLGAPMQRTGRQWRWGQKGSLALDVRGPKRGLWIDRSSDEGGDLLALVMRERRCAFSEAIRFARDWLGTGRVMGPVLRVRAEQAQQKADEAADIAQRIGQARGLWLNSRAIAGGPAESYLTRLRSIPCPAGGWPDAVQFHPHSRSLIVAATDAAGAVQAVQRVRLMPNGRKAAATPELPTKQTNGVLAGAAMRLPGDPAGPLLIAEGPETGLSIWAATGYETWVAFGSVGKLKPPTGRALVLCRDDDKPFSPADHAFSKAATGFRTAGFRVLVATPWTERRGDKTDFNDVLQANGLAAVQTRIAAALASPPPTTGRRRRVLDGRDTLKSIATAFMVDAATFTPGPEAMALPPVRAVRVDTGVGKSVAARLAVANRLAVMRGRLDRRTVVFAVPTLKLGDEQAAEFEAIPAARAAGLTAQIWRGRNAADPDAPGQKMCREPERVAVAQEAGQDVQSACCKASAKDEPAVVCPFFDVCGYQAQRSRRADVTFAAHEMLFQAKPAAFGDVAALVVDESAWQDGLQGLGAAPLVLSLDSLMADDAVPGDPQASRRLRVLRDIALDALCCGVEGPVLRAAMRDVGMTATGAAEARALEWRRKVDAGMHPAMAPAERKAAARQAGGNRLIGRLAMFWRAMEALLRDDGPEASGWAALSWSDAAEGRVRVLVLKGRDDVAAGFQVPTLLLDATLQIDLVRPFWPAVELVADVAVATPHMTVRQVVDKSYAKSYLELRDGLSDDEHRIRSRHLRGVNATIAAFGRRYAPGRVLVVAQQAIEQALPTVGMLPPNVETAHHNAVSGLDRWKDVSAVLVIGRTSPAPATIARIAEALTGTAMPLLTGWFPKVTVPRELASGELLTAECDRHPDPVCEAIRWHICEGELVQIIGRARGVNRTKANPVDVLVMTDAVLPLPLAGIVTAAELAPTPAELMLGTGGVAFENPTDAAAAYPDLWNREAAKKSFKRTGAAERLGTFPAIESLSQECPQPPADDRAGLKPVAYQLAGAGKRAAMAWIDPALIHDPAATLAAMLGPLAWFKLADPEPAVEVVLAAVPAALPVPLDWLAVVRKDPLAVQAAELAMLAEAEMAEMMGAGRGIRGLGSS